MLRSRIDRQRHGLPIELMVGDIVLVGHHKNLPPDAVGGIGRMFKIWTAYGITSSCTHNIPVLVKIHRLPHKPEGQSYGAICVEHPDNDGPVDIYRWLNLVDHEG